jgi:ABC-type tungstate transport system permease subunit
METLKKKIVEVAERNKMAIYDRSAESEQELKNLNVTQTLKNTKLPVIFMSFEKVKEYHIAIINTSLGNGFAMTFSYNTDVRPKLFEEILGYTNKYRSIVRTEYWEDGYPVKGHLVTDCQ